MDFSRLNLNSAALHPIDMRFATYTPLPEDVTILERAFNNRAERKENANKLAAAMQLSLNDLDLNPAEDAWRQDFVNKYTAPIQSLLDDGSFADAAELSLRLGTAAKTDPGLRGRIKAQQEYKKFVDTTLSRNDLTEDDKDWALSMNPYKYEDKVNDKGEVIGGSEWKYSRFPVGQIDYNKLLQTAKSLVFQESGGATDVVFFDANGKDTKNPLTAEGVKYYKNGTWQGISKNKLSQLMESVLDNEPGARARIDQDWEVANWKYDKLSEEEKLINKPSELFASNGKKYTKQEWYNNKFGRAINQMSGINRTSTIKYDNDYSTFMAARRASAIGGTNGVGNANDPFAGQINLSTNLGNPAVIETEDIVNKAFGKVTSGVQNLESIVPGLKDNAMWKIARRKNDYNTMINILKHNDNYRNSDAATRANIDQKLRDLKDNASLVNSIKKETNNFDAIAFNGALTTGGELPGDNNYTSQYMSIYNSLGGPKATSLRYSFSNNNELVDFANSVGLKLNGSDCKRGETEEGLPCIIIDKNNTINYKALDLYYKLGNVGKSAVNPEDNWFKRIFNIKRTNVVGLDRNGALTKTNVEPVTYGYINLQPSVTDTSAKLNRMNSIVNKANEKATNSIGQVASNKIEVTTKNMQLPEVLAAETQYFDDPSKQKASVDLAVDKAVNNILGMHGSQYEMMIGDEAGNLRKSVTKDRTEALEQVQSYITQNRAAAKDILGLKIVDGKIGYRIRIPKQWNESKNTFVDGDIIPNEIVIFNPDDPYLQRMQRDTKFIGATKYDRLSRVNSASHTTFDNDEIKFINGNPFINGIPTNKERAISLLSKDEGYNQLKEELLDNITADGRLTPGYANAFAQYIQSEFGYSVGTPANISKAAELITQMKNELE